MITIQQSSCLMKLIKRGDEMTKISQSERILQFIKEKGSITRLQAANEIVAFELSARIVELEREGYLFLKEPVKKIDMVILSE
ncbi:helix-turn-helix domain-containing protein [Lactococcus lactis]